MSRNKRLVTQDYRPGSDLIVETRSGSSFTSPFVDLKCDILWKHTSPVQIPEVYFYYLHCIQISNVFNTSSYFVSELRNERYKLQ